ncbi:transporter [Sulfurimonas paralvinellae]|uniref:Transporter n=1 Tax=Sulfurimonas paralvinellae TaxID=317658 RepID=A0A7M1BBF9_9BACT|nr:transporter [Sulfurimonas paralvinellae]QOP46776.1 transporter [Sulfurimonas paralvinellae]
MKKKLLTLSLLGATLLNAQVIPGINSKGGAMTLPEGKFKMGIKNIYMKRDHMFDGTHEVTNREHLDATANATLLVAKYGVSKNFDVRVVLPYKHIEATAKLGPNDVAIDNQGVGDMVVMGRYVVLPMKEYGYQVSVGAGVKLPTGSTDDGFKKAPPFAATTNTPLPTQMGTGEYEYKAELGVSKVINDTMRVDFNTMYTYRPKAEHDYDFGNELSYDLSFTSAVTDKINLGIEYNGKYNSKTDMGNDTTPALRQRLPFKAFSGTVGYITPEVEFLPFGKPKIHLGVGMSFLAHYNLSEYQPLEKQRFVCRLGYLF